ncbi:membrane protein BRI3 [Onthophagus taurus]|uniref:membrane protein BRI3 n=1 Tax=Onthophagus taurus TaxID=166361 RepID=UPI0039BE3FBF
MSTKPDPPPPYPGPNPIQTGVHQPQYYPYQPSAPLNQGFIPSYGTSTHTTVIVPPEVIVVGACPACRIGILEDHFTCFGLLCAIFFFPIGILCCLADKTKRCSNCGAHFD